MTTHAKTTQIDAIIHWNLIWKYKVLFITMLFLSALMSLGIIHYSEPVWGVTQILKVGNYAEVTDNNMVLRAVDSPSAIALRIQNMECGAVQKVDGTCGVASPDENLFKASVRVNSFPNSDLLELKFRAYSKEMADKAIAGIVDFLRNEYEPLLQSRRTQLKADLDQTVDRLRYLTEQINILHGKIFEIKQDQMAVLLMYQGYENQRYALQNRKRLLESAINSITAPIIPVANINITASPLLPNKPLIVLMTIFLGLTVALAGAIVLEKQKA